MPVPFLSLELRRLPQAPRSMHDLQVQGAIFDRESSEWISDSFDAGFKLDVTQEPLPPGWYLLDAMLESEDKLSPEFWIYFSGGAVPECVVLPHPGSGCLHVLLLLKDTVAGLMLRPHDSASRFRVGGISLLRVSRIAAFKEMLAPPTGTLAGAVSALCRFGVDVVSSGLRKATDRLFWRYRTLAVPSSGRLDPYSSWLRRYDENDLSQVSTLRARAADLARTGPLISIVIPVYQTDQKYLKRCLDSVLAQHYSNWQICVSDDASPDEEVREVVRRYASRDERITYVFRERNGHISASTNSAIDMATGEYLSFLDHDDELRPHALLEVAEAILRNPGVGLLYSDEDKIDGQGRRFHPNFKPDWNPDLLRSQNYICHLTTIRADLVREVGGLRVGFEGSQDHDLILRCIERLAPGQIHHIPKVLYHWRAIEGSTALARDAKDYAAEAGARAVQEHLDRIGSGASVDMLPHGHYRVRWPLPVPAPKVSLIIPTRDKADLLRKCIGSVLDRTSYQNFEIVVVDNQSSDPDALEYLETLQSISRVRVLRYDEPFNYSLINNWAVKQCDGAVIGLLNNDVEVISHDWLEEMVAFAVRPDVGAVGAMLYYPNDTIQHAGVILGIHGVAAHVYCGMPRGYAGHAARAMVAQNLSAVTGACLVTRRSVYEEAGGLDGAFKVAFNDIDFCLRIMALGYRNVWTPFAELYHHESATRGIEDTEDKKMRFANEVKMMMDRWGDALSSDPAYNPNLSLDSLMFDPAVAPRVFVNSTGG